MLAARVAATRDVSFQFKFSTKIRNDKTFLYNTGQINSIGDATWNRPQFYSLTRIKNGNSKVLASKLAEFRQAPQFVDQRQQGHSQRSLRGVTRGIGMPAHDT